MARVDPTRKQKNLAKLAIKHPTMPKGKLVALGGYSKAVVKNPSKVLRSKGFKTELENFGLTEELIKKSLVNDIKKKRGRRVKELALGANILRLTDNSTKIQINIANVLDDIFKPDTRTKEPTARQDLEDIAPVQNKEQA